MKFLLEGYKILKIKKILKIEKKNLDDYARKLANLYGIEIIEKPKSSQLVLENVEIINQDNPNFFKLAFGIDIPSKYTEFEKRQFRLDVKIHKFKTLPYDNYLNPDQLKNFVQLMNDTPFNQNYKKLCFDDDIKSIIQRHFKIFENLEKKNTIYRNSSYIG